MRLPGLQKFWSIILSCSFFLTAFSVGADPTVIENVTVIDGNGGRPVSGMHVLVRDGQIAAISRTSPKGLPEGTVRIYRGALGPGRGPVGFLGSRGAQSPHLAGFSI